MKSSLHVAVIMDGNGRWAAGRSLPRVAGHRAGVAAVRRTVEAAGELGISTLTLYAFSSDNWRRPAAEVGALMILFEEFLAGEAARCVEKSVRMSIIGRRDRISASLARQMVCAEGETKGGSRLHLRVAFDYSGREAIVAGKLGPDVDLLIRTGGERRLSDFLIWESAYAELYFTPRMWPDFDADDLEAAMREFHGRERRFGGLGQWASGHCEAGKIHHVRGDRWLR